MSLTEQDVQRVAKLARIRLSQQGLSKMQTELSHILTMLEKLRTIDTEGVAPMSHAQDIILHARKDCVTEDNQRTLFQQNAPQTEDGLYLVPKVIE